MTKIFTLKWQTSFRFRLVVVTMMLVCLVVGLLSSANFLRRSAQIEEETRQNHERLASLMANTLAPALFNFNMEAILIASDALVSRHDIERIAIHDSEGRLVVQTSLGTDQKCLQHPIRYGVSGRTYELGVFSLCLSHRILDEELGRAALDTALSGILIALSSIAAMFLSLRLLLKPLVPIISSLNQLKNGDLSVNLPNKLHKDEFGQLEEVILGFRDALVRQAESNQRLQFNEIRFRDFSKSSADWFWEMDANLRFCFFSENFELVYGHHPDKLLGHTRREILASHPGNNTSETLNHLAQLDRHEAFRNFTYSLIDQNGKVHWFSISGLPYWSEEGEFLGYRGIGEDITEEKQKDEELIRYQHHLEKMVHERTDELENVSKAAQAASAAKSNFLATMSHELRTPLSGIMGMIRLAKMKSQDSEVVDQLRKATVSSEHLMSVINDILDISKIEARQLEIEKTSFKLIPVFEGLISMLGHKAKSKGVKLETLISPDLIQQGLLGDPLRLSQVVTNLTMNALKFTEKGGVTLSVKSLYSNDTEVALRFEVIDTGIGISEEQQTKLFKSFEQADTSISRKYGGSGLGLAISKELVELMGGTIGVISQFGQGSTFWFELTLSKTTEDAYLASVLSEEDMAEQIRVLHSGKRILLAEDEPIIQEISRMMLEEVGLTVDFASTGLEAVKLANTCLYSLILMDMQMPEMNGVDATFLIKEDSLNRATPILAMTANAFSEDRERCLAVGMKEHIAKPVEPTLLFASLLRWL